MPDIVRVLWRFFSVQWNGLPVASLGRPGHQWPDVPDDRACADAAQHLEHWLCAGLAGLPVAERVAALRIRAAEWVWATSPPSARCT
jgi:hypothetical protein